MRFMESGKTLASSSLRYAWTSTTSSLSSPPLTVLACHPHPQSRARCPHPPDVLRSATPGNLLNDLKIDPTRRDSVFLFGQEIGYDCLKDILTGLQVGSQMDCSTDAESLHVRRQVHARKT